MGGRGMLTGHPNRYDGAWVAPNTRRVHIDRTAVTVVHAPGDGYPPGAQFGVVQARETLRLGGFDVGTVLRCGGRCAIVERGNKLSKQIFNTKGWK